MAHPKRPSLFHALLNLRKTARGQRLKKLSYRRLFCLERLEERSLLATVIWGNAAGGNWNLNTNWIGGAVPAAGDDVIIPDMVGTPTITYNAGTIAVKSLTINEAFVLAGGTLSATTISQLAGSFTIAGGTLNSSTLAAGKATVSVGATFGDFTIATGAVLDIAPSATAYLSAAKKLKIQGTANFRTNSVISLDAVNNGTAIVVEGVLNATGTTIAEARSNWATRLQVTGSGILNATNTTFTKTLVELINGATLTSGSWVGNRFDTAIYVPWQTIPYLSAANGGADNVRFKDINILAGTVTSGTTLNLSVIGTDINANTNLRYVFADNLIIASGATLNLNDSVKSYLAAAKKLTIQGVANFKPNSVLSLDASGRDTAIFVEGVLNTSGATIAEVKSNWISTLQVIGSGKLNATNTTMPGVLQLWAITYVNDFMYDGGGSYAIGRTGNGVMQIITYYRSIDVKYGSTLSTQSIRIGETAADTATLKVSYSSTLALSANLQGKTRLPSNYLPQGRVLLNGSGTSSNPQLIEVMGADLGASSAGFSASNFVYGKLELANNTYARLTNVEVNSVGATNEALYVNTLIIPTGAKLDLNGQKLYVRAASIATGGLVNGTVVVLPTIVPDGGPLAFSTPTPGTIDDSQRVSQVPDEWTFTATQNLPVAIQVNPGASGVTGAVPSQLQRVRVELLNTSNTVLKFAENDANGNIVTLTSDNLVQGQAYKIRIRPHSAFTSNTGNYVVTLIDAGTVETLLSIAPAANSFSKVEGNSGSSRYTYNIARFGDLSSPSSVSWRVTGSGTNAAIASDFVGGVLPSGILNFAASEATKAITVDVNSDTDFELDESFTVTLSNPSNGTAISVATASSVIVNDDVPQFSDLIVDSITPPTAARSGQKVTIGWSEKNDGPVALSGSWSTKVNVVNRATSAVIVDRTLLFPGNTIASKASVSRSTTVDLPDGVPGVGDFDVTIQVDSANNITESNLAGNAETNNATTSAFSSTIADYPALSVSQLNVPANVQLSVPFDISWYVLNSGNASLTKSIRDRVYLSTDDKIDVNDRILATVDAGSRVPLAAGDSYGQAVAIVLPLDIAIPAGQYQILVATDFANDQFELDESNNKRNSLVNITVPPLPDLMVESITTKDLVVAGQSVDVSWTVRNQGTASATGTWTDRVFISDDGFIGNDLLLKSFPITTTILAGGIIQRTQSVQIPAGISGAYRVVVFTDADNAVQEFNREGNNIAIDDALLNIDARPSPNLIIDSVISLTSNLFTGQPATIDWVVRNTGNASTNTSSWEDYIYLSTDEFLSDDDAYLGKAPNTSYLNVNEVYLTRFTVTLPQDAVGTRRFIVKTDATNRVVETGREDDNTRASAPTTISLTPPPDLIVANVTGPRDALEGEPIIVNWTVRNQGPGPTRVAQWTDQVYLSLNGTDIDATDTLLKTVSHDGVLAANGDAYSVTNLSVLLPENKVSDNAYILVRTDASKSVYEHSFEGNNDKATEFPMKIVLRSWPDLAVESIVPVASATAGQPLTIAYTVKNQSVIPTRQSDWQDSFYLSSDKVLDPQTDLLLGRRSRSGVLQGEQAESKAYNFVLPDTLQGNYFILVSADSDDEVPENDNANNIVATANATSIVINPPDLVLTSLGTSNNPNAGREFSVSYSVTNLGNSPTPNNSWTDSIYLSADAKIDDSDRLLDQRLRTGVLAPNQIENRTINFRLPTDRFGASFVIVHSDSNNSVYELNDANNISPVSIFIGDDRPDLRVLSFTPRLGSRTIAPGSSLSLDYEIENRGLGATYGRPWTDRVVLTSDLIVGNSDDVTLGSFTSPGDLGSGRSYFRLSESIAIPANTPEGLYRLALVADALGVVPELNDSNNTFVSTDFSVTTATNGTQFADLQVTALTIPSNANSGELLPLSWSVKNTGTVAAPTTAWNDAVWLSQDSSIDNSDILVGNYTHYNGLGINQSYSRQINWPIGIDVSGSYFLIVQTDSNNSVIEGPGEGNNKGVSVNSTNIALSPTPDLQVASINVPTQAFSGRTISVSWSIENAGGGVANASWADSVYLSLDQILDRATDIPLGYLDRTSNLLDGQSYTATANMSIPAGLGGAYYVLVVTDSTNRVYERQLESNNLGIASQPTIITHLPPADLVVGDITIPSNGDLGQTASITYTVLNQGQNLARGGWYDAIYISSDVAWDIDDGYFGRVWRSADVAANTSYTSTLSAPLPGVLPGNYKVIIRSDIRNNLVENNEANNLKASLNAFATDAPALTLGIPRTATITANGSVYYKVDVTAGETLVIEFDSASAVGSSELYASFGTMPRRSLAEFSALQPFQTDQRIVISTTHSGTYYILAFGNAVENGSSDFSILARTVQFTVFDTGYGQGGTAGDRTIAINGAKFDRSVTATLVDSDGRTTDALRYTRTSDIRLYATFDLRALATGTYSVRLSKEATTETILVPNALDVVFTTASLQPVSLTRPDTFNRRRDDRPPATIPVTVAWRNNTLNDIAVPLIHFSSTEPFAATLADANSGKTIVSTEFLGFTDSDGPKDILLSGEFTSASFFVKPAISDAASPPVDIHYVAEYFYDDSKAAYIWDYDLSQLDLSYLSDDEAIEAILAFKLERGETLGALRQALVEGLRRSGNSSPMDINDASRYLLQEVFDRFCADRQTSLAGSVNFNSLAVNYQGLVLTLSEVGGSQSFSSAVLSDGSFVFPKLPALNYSVSISGGAVKAPAGLQVRLEANQHAKLIVSLEAGPLTTAAPVSPRVPSGIAKVSAPFITKPGKINEPLTGNALESVLTALNGKPYRVELIGGAPLGFSLESDGGYRYLSSETSAFVVHYDLVTPDTETRVGRLFNSEIRSRGAIAITLKNNFTRDVRALDPNDILGPAGYGPEKWVSASERLPYTIRFENDPKNAMSPAQIVRVVQVLDSDLDTNSFQFGDFGFGGREYKVPTGKQTLNYDLDLRAELKIIVRVFARIDAATREISWTLSSISPETGGDTTDPNDGFLPLNLLPPQGDGFVSYSIRAKKSAATGSKIEAMARIIFDGNTPIDTPTIFNTLDSTKPMSTIAAADSVPSEQKLKVKWSGDDGEIGAGLSAFDVYVSENSGRYRPWLQNTTLVEAEFPTLATMTYDFVTIAKDNVGNGEEESKIPDSQRPTAFAGGPYSATEGVPITLSGSGQDPDASQTLSYEWDLDFDGGSFQVDSTLQSPQVMFNDGPSTRTVGLRVKDNGAKPLHSPVALATVSIKNVAPVLTQKRTAVTGNAGTTLRNDGTWKDVADDLVSLTASLGDVIKNSDGTWSWSFVPLAGQANATVTITAKDKDNDKTSVSFTISVNNSPSDIDLSSNTLSEQLPVGTVVGVFQSTDPDANNTFSYSLVAGLSDTQNDQFSIVGNELRTTAVYNVDADTNYSIRVRSTDQDGAFLEKAFAIRVLDTTQFDFGDAPLSSQTGFANSYPTLLSADGARHSPSSLILGKAVDPESNGVPTLDAMGDDNAGVRDEDGITFGMAMLASRTSATTSSLIATASDAGLLDAWVDFNQDGDWDDAGEQIFGSRPVIAGENRLSFTIPVNATAGSTYARFRLSAAGGLRPTGSAVGGEVEDYRVNLLDEGSKTVLVLTASMLGPHDLFIENNQLTIQANSIVVFSASANAIDSVQLIDGGGGIIYEVTRPESNLFGVVQYLGLGFPVRVAATKSFIDLTSSPAIVVGVGTVDLSDIGLQELIVNPASINAMNSAKTLKVIAGKDDKLTVSPTWKLERRGLVDGKLVHTFENGSAKLELQNYLQWQNFVNKYDVNANGSVEPLDVLIIINQINTTAGSGNGAKLPEFDASKPDAYSFVDVNGNNTLDPLDVLEVINYINRRGSGEGESNSSDNPLGPVDWSWNPSAFVSRWPEATRGFTDSETSVDELFSFENRGQMRLEAAQGGATPLSYEASRKGNRKTPDKVSPSKLQELERLDELMSNGLDSILREFGLF